MFKDVVTENAEFLKTVQEVIDSDDSIVKEDIENYEVDLPYTQHLITKIEEVKNVIVAHSSFVDGLTDIDDFEDFEIICEDLLAIMDESESDELSEDIFMDLLIDKIDDLKHYYKSYQKVKK